MVDHSNHYRDKVSQLISWGHWYCFFNIIAATLLGTSYIFFSGWPETFFGQIYQLISWIGHFGFLTFTVYLLLIFPTSFIITSQRMMRFCAVLVATAGHTLLLLDIYVYQSLNLHLNPTVWELLLHSENSKLSTEWQHLFVIVPALFLAQIFVSEWVWRKLKPLSHKRLGLPIALALSLCFFSSHLIYIWADAFLYSPITSQRSNFPLSYPMTAKTFMEKYGILDRNEYHKRREEQGKKISELIKYPLSPIRFNPSADQFKPNLLVVMLDGLRADMLNPEVMPNLRAFSQESLNFTNHYSSSNDEMAGVWSFFYGLPTNYVRNIRTEGLKSVLLENVLKKDYQLGLFSSDNFKTPIYYQSIFGKLLKKSTQIDDLPSWKADEQSINKAIHWMNEQAKSPWFTYINLKSIALYEQEGGYAKPFQPLIDTTEKLTPQNSSLLKNSYQNASFYVDTLLAKLIVYLKQSEQLNNTIVIFTADHGMEFNETGTNSWGANSNYSQYQLKVPLVMHWPSKEAKEVTLLSSHLDLVPTLMEGMFGVNSPANQYSSGTNLFDLTRQSRKWVLAGDSQDIVIVQKDKTMVIDKFGNYQVYDAKYHEIPEEKPQFSIFMQVMAELQRFYTSEGSQ